MDKVAPASGRSRPAGASVSPLQECRRAAACRLLTLVPLLLAGCASAPGGSCTVHWHSTLPVTMHAGLAVVAARINGEPVGLGVDSGAEHTMVTPELVAALDLRPDPGRIRDRVSGIGGGAYSQVVALASLQFAGVTYGRLDALAASLGPLGIGTAPVSGLLGEDLLSRYDVGFDIAHREISLYTVRNCRAVSPPWGTATGTGLGLSRHNHLVFPVELDGHRLVAMLDSGAGDNVLLEHGAEAMGLTTDQLAKDDVVKGQGVGERIVTSRLHRFSTLKVGGETIRDPRIGVLDSGEPDIDLILGMPFLQRRQVYVSHATAQMFVRDAATAPLAEQHD